VSLEKVLPVLGFFLVLYKLHGGPKRDKIWAYFETPPVNFLLPRPNAADYCNSEKKTCYGQMVALHVCHGLVNFGVQTPEIHAPHYCS